MSQNLKKQKNRRSFELKILVSLFVAFIVVMISAWGYSLRLQHRLNTDNSGTNPDVQALVLIEKIRNVAKSQYSNSLTFFLMGSTTLFDEQKKDKRVLTESLSSLEKQYALPKVHEIVSRIETLQLQQQEFFDQAMEFRAKQTESKIVGQFFRSKVGPIADQTNKALDEILLLYNAEFERSRSYGKEAAAEARVLIPRAMSWLTIFITSLFLGLVLLVLRMLNERSRQKAERSRLYEEAKRAIHARDEILAAVSQDLKEPLAAIQTAAEAVMTPSDSNKINENIEVIKSSALAIEGFTHDVLDQTKFHDGSMVLRFEQLAVDNVLDESRLMLQSLAKKKNIRLEFNSVNPPALAFMDRERVMRVLSNLIGNAIKFSPKNSKVVVKVRSDQQFIFISVKDEGPGIPEKQIPEIFSGSWQARKTADQGSGIGLAVVKTIAEAHGGTVSVESHVGHGSTFTFSLPRRRPAGANFGKSAPARVRTTHSQPQQSEIN